MGHYSGAYDTYSESGSTSDVVLLMCGVVSDVQVRRPSDLMAGYIQVAGRGSHVTAGVLYLAMTCIQRRGPVDWGLSPRALSSRVPA